MGTTTAQRSQYLFCIETEKNEDGSRNKKIKEGTTGVGGKNEIILHVLSLLLGSLR